MGTYDIGGGAAAGAQSAAQGIGSAFKALAMAPMAAQQAEQNQALILAKIFANQQSGSKHEQEALGLKMTNDARSNIDAELLANQNLSPWERAQRIAFQKAGPQYMDNWSRSGQIEQKTADIEAIKRNPMLATPAAQAYAATSGIAPYDNIGNTGRSLNKLSGQQIDANSAMAKLFDGVQGSVINENNQQARAASALADQRFDELHSGGKQKALTEGQAKANLFGARMTESTAILNELEDQGVMRPGSVKSTAETLGRILGLGTESMGGTLADAAGTATNWTQSKPQQKVDQARRDFINSTLRKESGASISPQEFISAEKQYFPQAGDSKEVIEQKRANRELATRMMLSEVPSNQRYQPKPRNSEPTSDGNGGWSIRRID